MSQVISLEELQPVKNRFSLQGRKALVTGGGGGIGRSTAAALAELGADVALVDLNFEKAQQYAEYITKKFEVKAFAIACDVSDEVQVDEMIATAIKEMGTVDAVHSNAGIIIKEDCADITIAEWKRIVDINLTGMFLVNRAAARHMREVGNGGAIVNTASMSAHIINRSPERHMVGYATTKGGVLHLTKAMAMDFCKDNIRVNSISPGYMYSGLHDNMSEENLDWKAKEVPMRRFGTMDEIGGIVAFLLSDLASYITGSDILVDGGYSVW